MPWNILQRIQQVDREQGSEIIALWLQYIYIQLEFSPKAAKLLIKEQGIDSPERLRVLADKNVDDICNIMRKPGGMNAHEMLYKGQQVSVIVQENLKLASFIFHNRWRCTFAWEDMAVNGVTVCLLADQKKLKDE